jgi:hypothetical protein
MRNQRSQGRKGGAGGAGKGDMPDQLGVRAVLRIGEREPIPWAETESQQRTVLASEVHVGRHYVDHHRLPHCGTGDGRWQARRGIGDSPIQIARLNRGVPHRTTTVRQPATV